MNRADHHRRADWLLVAVLLLAFGLRLSRLGDQNIWWDEGYSVYVARQPQGALTTTAAADTHPPLYYWLLHGWMAAGGQTEFALRFPSAAFGLLTVALIGRLGRRLGMGGGAAWLPALAGLLLAISRFHVWWSQEIRMYSLAALWAAVSLEALLRFTACFSGDRPGQANHAHVVVAALLYALSLAGGLYSLYVFVFIAAAQALWLAWLAWQLKGQRRITLLAYWIGATVLAGIALLPWLAYTLPRLKSWSAASTFSPLTYLQVAWTGLTLGLTENIERYWPVNLIFLAVLVVGLGVASRPFQGLRFRFGASLLTPYSLLPTPYSLLLTSSSLALLVPLLGVFALLSLPQGLFYRPPLEARYQLLSLPALYLLLAAAVGGLWHWRKVAGVVAAVAILLPMLAVLPGYYQGRHLRDDFQTMTRAIEAQAEADDALLLVAGDRFPLFNFRYDVLPRRAELPAVTTLPLRAISPQDAQQALAALAGAHRRVWLAEVEKNLQDPDGRLAAWLDEHRVVVWRESYGYNRLTLYSIDQTPPLVQDVGASHDVMGYFSQSVELGCARLVGYDWPVREVWPGDTARLVAYLDVRQACAVEVGAVSFADSGGLVLEARRYALEPAGQGLTRLRFDLPVYAHTPPGDYAYYVSSLQRRDLLEARLRVVSRPGPSVGSIPNRLDVQVGEHAHLMGYQSPVSVRPGDRLAVTLYWRASAKIEAHDTVFVQLVGTTFNPQTNGPLWAGHDSEPLDGGYPTTQWLVGQPLADSHNLAIPPEAPPGDYELWAGMYTQPDIQRLPVYDSLGQPLGDHIVLGKIVVQ